MTNEPQLAWEEVGLWCKDLSQACPQPTPADLEAVTTTCQKLCSANPPAGDPIPTHVDPFPVSDDIPSEEEIATAICCFKNCRAAGLSGTLKTSKAGFCQPTRRTTPGCQPGLGRRSVTFDQDTWDQVVLMVQEAFRTGKLPTALSHAILVVLPKPGGGQ